MIRDDSENLKSILEDICIKLKATHVIAVDRDGIPISAFAQNGYFEFALSQHISALSGAMFQTGVELGGCVGFGDVELQLTRYHHGYLIAKNIAQGLILIFLPTKAIDMEHIIETIRINLANLEIIIENYACIEAAVLDDELRDLFSRELDLD